MNHRFNEFDLKPGAEAQWNDANSGSIVCRRYIDLLAIYVNVGRASRYGLPDSSNDIELSIRITSQYYRPNFTEEPIQTVEIVTRISANEKTTFARAPHRTRR